MYSLSDKSKTRVTWRRRMTGPLVTADSRIAEESVVIRDFNIFQG